MIRVLVTGAGSGLGNNVIRSLRAAAPGLAVVGCHSDRFLLAKSDADVSYLVPPAHDAAHVAALRRLAARECVALIIPTSDQDVRVLSRHRRRLGARVFLPRHPVIELCQDKYHVSTFLRRRGVPAPRTLAVGRDGDVARLLRRLPPGRAWCRVRRGSGSYGAAPVDGPAQARAWMRLWREMRGVPVRDFTLCEYLPGRDFGCQSVWKDGRLALAKTYERLSYLGSASQPSEVSAVGALTKTVREPGVLETAVRAIRAVDRNASGVFAVDLKEDAGGIARVTEINAGRFTSSTNLLDLTGKHNMTAVYLDLARGEPVDLSEEYEGTEDHYMLRDIDATPRVFHADEFFDGVEDARR